MAALRGIAAAVADLAGATRAAAAASAADDARRPYRVRLDYASVATWHTMVDDARVVPAADGLQVRRPEAELLGAGWRFVALPRFKRHGSACYALEPALDWDGQRAWLAVPPDGCDLAARRFAKKGDAITWARATTQGGRA